MKCSKIAAVCVAIAWMAALGWLGAVKALAQGGDWDVVRAEYGVRGQNVDVTDRVLHLLWEEQRTGRAPVNNDTMGGDPAPGADKTLRIFARNGRNEQREFAIREGGWIEIANFRVQEVRYGDYRDDRSDHRDDRYDDDCWCREGNEGRWRGERGLRILRAYYGAGGQTANVTDIVKRYVRGDSLRIEVDNRALGGDPAPSHDKVLIVIFRYEGRESASSVKEGYTMHIP